MEAITNNILTRDAIKSLRSGVINFSRDYSHGGILFLSVRASSSLSWQVSNADDIASICDANQLVSIMSYIYEELDNIVSSMPGLLKVENVLNRYDKN